LECVVAYTIEKYSVFEFTEFKKYIQREINFGDFLVLISNVEVFAWEMH
jgi:hypothetical protein